MHENPEKLHILHIPRWYPNAEDPMPGLFVKYHAESLSNRCDNSVLYLHFTTNRQDLFAEDTKLENGVFCHTIYIRKATSKSGQVNQILNSARFLKAFIKGYRLIRSNRGKPHLSHAHVLTRPGIPALLLRWFCGIPYLVSEHWSRYFPGHDNYKGLVRHAITRLVLKKSEALLCVSASLRQAMQEKGLDHKNYFTVPNVTDTGLFKPSAGKKPSDKIRLIHISCFEDRSKNIAGLLNAIRIVRNKGHQVSLQLVGEGADKQEMEKLAATLGLFEDQTVVFSGLLQASEVAEALQQSDFLIQTSHYETFSTVVIESFACGIPVISTPVGIFPEIYESGLGIMIPSTANEDIANSIVEAIAMKSSFDPGLMREIAVQRFSNESVGRLLLDIYVQSLKKSK